MGISLFPNMSTNERERNNTMADGRLQELEMVRRLQKDPVAVLTGLRRSRPLGTRPQSSQLLLTNF